MRRGLGRTATYAVYGTRAGVAAGAAVDALPGARPASAIIAGLCGSLAASHVAGDVLIYDSIGDADGEPLETDAALSETIGAALPGAHRGVSGVSAPRVVTAAAAKRELAVQSGADAVDMESYELARRLYGAGIPFAIVRCVSDGPSGDLPDLNRAFGPDGIVFLKLLLLLLANPSAGARLAIGGGRGLAALRRAMQRLR